MPSLIGTNPNQVPTNGDLGTMAFQDKESVKIEGGVINNTPIGGTTPAAGAFTTLSATGNTTLGDSSTDVVTINGYMGIGGAGAASSGVGINVINTITSGNYQYGIVSSPTGNGASQINGVTGAATTSNTTFTCGNLSQFLALNTPKGAASTITNYHGLYIENLTQGTNNYGITSVVSSGANKWNVYASGTANNYFNGNVLIGTTTDDGVNKLQVNGSAKATQWNVSAMATAPASATDTGTLGEIRITATHIYVCTATNTWVRAALATWT